MHSGPSFTKVGTSFFLSGLLSLAQAQATADAFQSPVDNALACQTFGHLRTLTDNPRSCSDGTKNYRHTGEDVSCNQTGATVKAMANGVVMYARNNAAPTPAAQAACNGNWGFVMVIQHNTRFGQVSTIYGHIDPSVSEGAIVSQGDTIGHIADYHSTCPTVWENHLHSATYNGAYGAAQGTYAAWLNGYLCPENFPNNYLKTSDFLSCQLNKQDGTQPLWQFFDKSGTGDRSNDLVNASCWLPRGGATPLGFNPPGAWIMSADTDPQTISPPLSVNSLNTSALEVKIAATTSNQQAQVFFTTDSAPDFSADKSTDFQLIKNDGSYNTYVFPLTTNSNWTGTITRLRFDPVVTGGGKAIGIQEIKLLGPEIVSSVTLMPSSGPYTIGQPITAQFTIKNEGTSPITFAVVTLGGRLNGDNTCAGGCPDFPFESGVTLAAGQTWNYNETISFSHAGAYGFFATYKRLDGSWNTDIPTEPGVTNVASISIGGNSCGAAVASSSRDGMRARASGVCSPLPPDTPNPANGSTGAGLGTVLAWSGGSPAPSYDVYWGSSNPPPYVGTVSSSSYSPPAGLNANTTYYWYVAPGISGVSPSATWSFATISGSAPPGLPTNLVPSDGSSSVSVNPVLTWSPSAGATAYQVAFGTTNPPGAAATTPINSYTPGRLSGNTAYYWKVTATNSSGSTSSSVTSFTTATSPVSGSVLVSGLSNPRFIAADATSIYWSEFGGLIRKVAKSGGNPITLYASPFNPSGIAVDDTNVYFGDGLSLRAIPKNGGNSVVLAAYSPSQVALDTNNVYGTDYTAGAIRKVSKVGGTLITLATGSSSPSGIATDGANVYWSEQSWPGVVRQVSVNGGNPTILGYNVNNNGIAIDAASVYWGESIFTNQNSIDKAPLGGGATAYLASGLNNVWALATDGASVFWAEHQINGAVKQVTVTGSGPITLANGLADPVALVVDDNSVFWLERNDGGSATGTLNGKPKTPTVQTTVGTVPSGMAFQVDGVSYSTPQSFVWFQGSTHTVVAANQSNGPGSQYVWRSWSDAGGAAHSVTPTFNTFYTVTFEQQFYLSTTAAQGGSISPSSGWYDSGTIVPVNAQNSSGYVFTGFSGDLAGTSSPQSIVMNAARNIVASFAPSVMYSISGQIGVFSGSGLAGVTLSLNGSSTVTTDSSGNYVFSGVRAGGSYTLVPSLAGFVFSPASLSFANLSSSQTASNFAASRVASAVQATITTTGFLFSRATGTYTGTMTVKNMGLSTINGPIQILFAGLTSGVTFVKRQPPRRPRSRRYLLP